MQIGSIQKPALPGLEGDLDSRLAGAQRSAERGDTQETARQFETLFGVMLVRELRRSMPKGLFGDGAGADVYEGWFDQQLGDALAERDALGIAGMVKTSLGRAQAALESAPVDAPRAEAALDEPAPAAPVPPAPQPLVLGQSLPLPHPQQALPLPLAPARPRPLPLAPARQGPLPLAPVERVPLSQAQPRGATESGP